MRTSEMDANARPIAERFRAAVIEAAEDEAREVALQLRAVVMRFRHSAKTEADWRQLCIGWGKAVWSAVRLASIGVFQPQLLAHISSGDQAVMRQTLALAEMERPGWGCREALDALWPNG